MAVIQITSGVPGAGKTYSRVRFLINDYLVNNTGLYITNLPLNVELIAQDVSKKMKVSKQSIIDRIVIIPENILKDFQALKRCSKQKALTYADFELFPPAVYFESLNLSNAHIALDEFHLYFSRKTSMDIKDLWNDWISEIRKNGCTFEAITQDVARIPPEFMGKVSVRVDLMPLDITRDPFFNIKMYDWYQLRASFTGQTSQKVQQVETHKGLLNKWVVSDFQKFTIVPEIYKYYHTSTRNDGRKTDGEIPPFKRLSKMGLILWFIRRNFFSIFGRFCISIAFLWLTCFGGISALMLGFVDSLTYMSKTQIKNNKHFTKSKKLDLTAVEKKSKTPYIHPNEQKKDVDLKKSTPYITPFREILPSEFKNLNPYEKKIYLRDKEIYDLRKILDLEKKKEVAGYVPVMFFDDLVYLKNGLIINVNYKFKKGIHNEKTVKKVDFSKRCYYLDDDSFICM